MSQGENAYLVLRGVFHISPPALGGLSIELTFSSNAYLKLPTEWILFSEWLRLRRELKAFRPHIVHATTERSLRW